MKIVVFTIFTFDFNYYCSKQYNTTKIRKKLICSQKLPVKQFSNCSHEGLNWQNSGSLLVPPLDGIFLKTPIPLFPFFWLTKILFFQLFSKWVNLTALNIRTIRNKFKNCDLVNYNKWNSFMTFWRKIGFSRYLLNIYFQKNK